jgi:hypothetical protein
MPRVDFTSQDYLRDPAAGLTKLRAAGPVVQVRFPIIGRTWITTTNDLAGRVLKDSETFGMRQNGRVAGLRLSLRPNCSLTGTQQTWLSAMRGSCPSRSSASCSVFHAPTGRVSSPG